MLKHIFQTSIFLLALCVCAWWCIDSDNTPSPHIDFSKHTLHLPDTSPYNVYNDIIYFDIPNSEASAHASAIANVSNVSDKYLMLLYFAGSREGARDVGIYQSFFTFNKNNKNVKEQDSQIGKWSEPQKILDAPLLSNLSGKFIKKLGNPVTFVDTQGRTHLFVVGVSMGGWATSKIYHLMFKDNLSSLQYIRELHLSPFLNFSHLVRTPAMLKDDGGFILPIYHELARKYPLLLDFNHHLDIDSIFILPPQNLSQLQPSFVPLDSHSTIGVYRNHKVLNDVMQVIECAPLCKHSKPSNLRNYDASSVLFNALDSTFLLHNQSSRPQGNKREELWLYMFDRQSQESESIDFIPLLRLDVLLDSEVSYPSVALDRDFAYIAYTYGRKHIRVSFVPKSMLKAKLKIASEAMQ